jgi:hypothetical protein
MQKESFNVGILLLNCIFNVVDNTAQQSNQRR